MLPTRDYLLSFGRAGDIGRFEAHRPLACRRGDRAVVRTGRGLELGVIVGAAGEGHARLLAGRYTGELLRLATSDDLAAAQGLRQQGKLLFEQTRVLARSLDLPLDVLDIEILLDGKRAVLHFLKWADCDAGSFAEAIEQRHGVMVSLEDVTPVSISCGGGGCGSGGCGSCGSGGCSSCSGHQVHPSETIQAPTPLPDRLPLL